MNRINARGFIRLFAPALSMALWALGARCYAVTPTPFTPNNPIGGAPIGWAYAGNKFIGSVLDNNGPNQGQSLLYSTDLTGGNVQPFGGTVTLAPNFGLEHYVSSSIGLGGFPVGDIYVASGNNIQHITNAGVADPGLFVNGSTGGINGSIRGITFDAVGTFNHDMIVTTHTGFVYTIDSAGNATQIASTGEDTEGLDIAPLGGTWTGKNGWLFVASEGSGNIRAIKPNTINVTAPIVATVPSAEELDFVPLALGNNPLEGLYGGNYSFNVVHAGANQFLGMEGDIIVTGETTQSIYDVNFSNGVTNVGSFPNQPEDGLFVTATLIQDDNIPEPASLTLLSAGSLLLLRRRRRA
jgi:hypothetical protein